MDGLKLSFERRSRQPTANSPAPPAAPEVTRGKSKAASEPGLAEVTSPLLGIFYRAPRPGEPPFVDIGSRVDEDTVIGIVEVMKLMNSVHAGVKGKVVEILCENGALVEYGDVLLRVRSEA
jgi:acetyl-CoA carboxylase biotin carboxyl carrier protein